MAAEDFTTYTETDVDSVLTVTSSKATLTAADETNNFNLVKDKGVDHFADFELQWTLSVSAIGDDVTTGTVTLCENTRVSMADIITNNDGLSVYVLHGFINGNQLSIKDFLTDDGDAHDKNDPYTVYLTLTRVGTTVSLKIYSDAGRTTLLDTLSITGTGNTFRYLHAVIYRNSSDTGNTTLYIENLEEIVSTPPTEQPIYPNYFNKRGLLFAYPYFDLQKS